MKQKPKCNICGKIIAGIRNLNETNYCSTACMKSAELFQCKDLAQERRERFLRIAWIVIALIIAFFIGVFYGEYIIKQYLLNDPDMMQVCGWLVEHAK